MKFTWHVIDKCIRSVDLFYMSSKVTVLTFIIGQKYLTLTLNTYQLEVLFDTKKLTT